MAQTENPTGNPADKPLNLFWVIAILMAIFFLSYLGVLIADNYAELENKRNELTKDLILAIGVSLAFFSSLIYWPYTLYCIVKKEPFVKDLGALALYIVIGSTITFGVAVIAFVPIVKYVINFLI